jgi:hypothetical protein
MPSIVDYPAVLQRLESDGLKCNYYNGGSFSFPAITNPQIRGWIGQPDPSIRPEMQNSIRLIPEPYEAELTTRAAQAWRELLPGTAWIMPAAHWSFELEHGNRQWLPDLLKTIAINSADLFHRTNAAAIEFTSSDAPLFEQFLAGLLHALTGSDFTLAFPGRPAIATIHHHKQLWWVTSNQQLAVGLDKISG